MARAKKVGTEINETGVKKIEKNQVNEELVL